ADVQELGLAAHATELVDASITLDDEDAEDVQVHTVLIGNCGMIQGGINLLPDAVPDDGRLDVLLVSAEGVLGWLDTARSVLWDNGLRRAISGDEVAVSTDSATHASAERIRVTLQEPQPFEIDGEEAGVASSFAVRVQPGAVRVR